MISFLRGNLYQYDEESIIIDVNGIGYEIQVHSRCFTSLPSLGEKLFVYTYMQVLDNEIKLYGFMNKEELELFKTLITVSGIGAKGAMNILSAILPADFYQAIASKDEKRLVALPGIGKKTAQRLVFELKDRIGNKEVQLIEQSEDNYAIEDVLVALEALGYSRSEVFGLIMKMKENGELANRVEDNIKKVLQKKALEMKK